MTDSPAPLALFIPTPRLISASLKARPDLLEGNAQKKGSYVSHAVVKWDVGQNGFRLTVDPVAWMIKQRWGTIRLVEHAKIEELYESEKAAFIADAVRDAELKARDEFPSYKRWSLLRDLEATPR